MPLEDTNLPTSMNLFYILCIALAIVAILAIARPVLFKMGFRNAARRKAQTSLVVFGLMLGTAIMGGALVTSDSLKFTIIKGAYDSNGELDETVQTPGNLWFNMSLYYKIRDDAVIKGKTDAIAPAVYNDKMTVFDEQSQQTDPAVAFQGFDPVLDRGFGDFKTKGGSSFDGSDLGPKDCIINDRLASAIYAKEGDTLTLYFSPIDELSWDYLLKMMESGPGGPGGGGGGNATGGNGTGQNGTAPPAPVIRMASFTVKHIAKDEGKANLWAGKNIFVRIDVAQALFNVSADRINMIKLSNNGGVIEGVDGADDVKARLDVLIAEEKTGFQPPLPPAPGFEPVDLMLQASTPKASQVKMARTAADSFGTFLLMMSMFTVVTGVMLIINIFVMLAEERKAELGMSRAVGMKRSDLMRMFMFEGVVYSIGASAVGAFVGLGIGYVMIWGMNTVFGSAMGGGGSIAFYFYPSSLIYAFSLGGLITLATIAVACFRVSKLNIVRAIRNIDEPVTKRGGRRYLVMGAGLLALGALFTMAGIPSTDTQAIMQVLGPSIMFMGMSLVMRAYLSPKIAFTSLGMALTVYIMWVFLFQKAQSGENEGMVNLVLSGVLLVLGITVAVMFNSDFFVKGTGKLLGSIPRLRAIVTPAIGYPLNKRFRTGLTVSMFSLIMFIVTLFSIFFSVFTPDLEKQGGGMDILATTTLPVNDIYNVSFGTTGDNASNATGGIPVVNYDNLTKKVDWVASLYLYGYWGDLLVNDKAYPLYQAPYHQLYGIDATFAEHTRFSMKRMAKEYSTDREVWEALATTPGLCVIDTGTTGENYGIPNPMGPGDIVSFPRDQASSQAKFKVIGVVDEMILGGVFMGKQSMAENFTQVKGDTLFIMGVNKGEDIKDVAKGLEADFRAVGMNAIEVKATLVELNKALQQMFQMFEIFLALGLIIAVASLAVLAVRAVIERRREIGIMRAIGYKRSMIMGTFMTEILFVTSLGVLIGLAAGLIAGYGIWLTQMKSLGVAFNVPWSHVGLIIGLTYMFAIIFTILPSYRASRIPPAEAVRHTE